MGYIHRCKAGIDVPEHAQVVRTMSAELSRMLSHLLFTATDALDVNGGFTSHDARSDDNHDARPDDNHDETGNRQVPAGGGKRLCMEFTATVEGVTEVGPETVAVTVSAPAAFDARPGQFVRLTATVDGEDVSRFYTVSSPDTDETFETTVGLGGGDEDGPDFSAYLADLDAGSELAVTGPFGDQFYEGEQRALVLAGGAGVGPAVAIAERALADGNEAAVVYRDDAPAHTERLDALRDRGASVVVTDGAIGALVADAATGDPGEQAFVYGFADFVAEAEGALEAAGLDADDAKIENFG